MNVLIITIPIRDKGSFRPLGPLSIIKHLRNEGVCEVDLYDIDFLRPSFEEAVRQVANYKPAVLGISAVVSTSYEYTKKFSAEIRKILPNCLIVLGGNMGASAEIVLKRTEVDIVVLDDGEIPFQEICERAKTTTKSADFTDIKGLMLFDEQNKLRNTGYGETLPLELMWDFDYADLEKAHGTLEKCISLAATDGFKNLWYRDLEFDENARVGVLDVSKGCVARCTFCHRWTKGLRHVPIGELERRLKYLVEEHNVRFIDINAESFGNDKKWLSQFFKLMEKYKITWRSQGLRANTFSKDWIEKAKDAGCSALGFGNETGSEDMLKVMEKKVKLEDNYNSMRWTVEAGLKTGIQLVLGMPGESPKTVRETIEYTKFCVSLSPEFDPNNLSINYAQALPGTALYEYGRSHGLIGRDIDGEEAYLISISDRNAHDETTTINFTNYPTLIHRTWRPLITIETNYHYVKTYGLEAYREKLPRNHALMYEASGFFANPRRLLEQGVGNEAKLKKNKIRPPSLVKYIIQGRFGAAMLWYPILFYHLRYFLPFLILIKTLKDENLTTSLTLAAEYLKFKMVFFANVARFSYGFKSLRKIVENDIGPLDGDSIEMAPLRKGR